VRVHALADLPEHLRLVVGSGEPGTSLLCPMCDGGRTGEGSLSVFQEGAFATLKCWRAGCGYWARVMLDPTAKVEAPKFKPRPYRGGLWPLSRNTLAELSSRYGLRPQTRVYVRDVTSEGFDPEGSVAWSVYFPVYGPVAGDRGGVLRRFGTFEGPKSITYKTTDEPFQAWYLGEPGRPLVIVEDTISALRCWQLGYNSVALLGTNLNRAKFEEIAAFGGTPLLALDRDAFSVAVKAARRFGNLRPVLLDRDLKDCSDEEIEERLSE